MVKKMFYIKLYLLTLIAFLGLDSIWLIKIAPDFYKANIGHLLADKPNLGAATVFYLFNIVGIMIFAVIPSLKNNSVNNALLMGALYGFFTYATYDLTNYATLKYWPIEVVLVDVAWGVILSTVVSFVSYFIGTKLR